MANIQTKLTGIILGHTDGAICFSIETIDGEDYSPSAANGFQDEYWFPLSAVPYIKQHPAFTKQNDEIHVDNWILVKKGLT